MTDDEIKKAINEAVTEAVAILTPIIEEKATERGLAAGLIQGEATGFVKGVRFCQQAISDGTRKGSSECAKVLKFIESIDK